MALKALSLLALLAILAVATARDDSVAIGDTGVVSSGSRALLTGKHGYGYHDYGHRKYIIYRKYVDKDDEDDDKDDDDDDKCDDCDDDDNDDCDRKYYRHCYYRHNDDKCDCKKERKKVYYVVKYKKSKCH